MRIVWSAPSRATRPRSRPAKSRGRERSPRGPRPRQTRGEAGERRDPPRRPRQADMSLAEMLSDLPTHCAVGTKRNAKGHTISWIGYKLHLDIADGDVPISAVLTSASLHDCQAAIPLATMSAGRVTNLYDLMDSAYDVA